MSLWSWVRIHNCPCFLKHSPASPPLLVDNGGMTVSSFKSNFQSLFVSVGIFLHSILNLVPFLPSAIKAIPLGFIITCIGCSHFQKQGSFITFETSASLMKQVSVCNKISGDCLDRKYQCKNMWINSVIMGLNRNGRAYSHSHPQ